jgi:hypothetical protein
MDNKLVIAAIKLLEARPSHMLTEAVCEALAQAVKEETDLYIQWRNWDELNVE